MLKINSSKQKVVESASMLFFQKGFHGTSVRDIAEKASVNVSLISYYFKSKQGLLEYAVTNYYETYIKVIKKSLKHTQSLTALEQLKQLIFAIIKYKHNHYQFTCFIQRELTLDSIFVREMTVTYLAKENHLLSSVFFIALRENDVQLNHRDLLFLQLKGMMITPYMLQNEWKSQRSLMLNDLFVENYTETICQWLDFLMHKNKKCK